MAAGKVLFLVHDPDPIRGPALCGTLLEHVRIHELSADFAVPGRDVLTPDGYDLIVVMGSEAAAYDDGVSWIAPELTMLKQAIAKDVPVLGICFGGQLLARALGAEVRRAPAPERGFIRVRSSDTDLVPAGPWMGFHYDEFLLPPGATPVAQNDACQQAFTLGPHLGLQFHPEISPETFDTWRKSWPDSGASLLAEGVDMAAIAREVDDRAEQSAAACGRLFSAFWSRRKDQR
jgi:GMP synthase (glutamine-hydrolysing)